MARGAAREDFKKQKMIETWLGNYNELSKSEQADRGCGAGAQDQQTQDQAGQAAPEGAAGHSLPPGLGQRDADFSGQSRLGGRDTQGALPGKGKTEFFAHASFSRPDLYGLMGPLEKRGEGKITPMMRADTQVRPYREGEYSQGGPERLPRHGLSPGEP